MLNFVFLGIAIVGEVVATSALKASQGFTQLLPSLIVVIGYGIAFFFLSLTLKVIPIGIAYATWSGAGVVLVALIGQLWFHQKLDLAAVIGMGFIIVGVLLMNVVSKAGGH
ncbi:DMT family transporter [Pseudorhizobium marinum]|uniref:DMT family transporter n=1 Tax=Pseudorhizobium marinum TaxID=1496690 RepID=UPI0004954D61|nr:SMR family transporter [Pseudorhizobium marinum]